ncbi:MAG: phytanoyl-CoA dioxygenase family protein [Alphaproteobacteria bacterium]
MTQVDGILDAGQVAFYRENGYLVVPDVFSRQEVAQLNRVTDGFIEESRSHVQSDSIFDLDRAHSASDPKVRRVKNPHQQHDAYADAVRHPKLLAILRQLIGPAVRFDHSKLNIKPVGGGASIDWHQDWAFYPHTNDDLLAVGVFLGDVGEESGPLQVIPGSHRGPTFDHHARGVFCGAISDEDTKTFLDRAVCLTGPAGSVTIHHVRTVHGSQPNMGVHPRRLLLFSYAAVDAWPLVPEEDLESFDLRILCGAPTLAPRQIAVPVRLPLPRVASDDSIFDNQAHKREQEEPAVAAAT